MHRLLVLVVLSAIVAPFPVNANSLAKAKVGFHAVPIASPPLACGDAQFACADAGGSNLSFSVPLGSYRVYLVVLDWDTTLDFSAIQMQLDYDPGVVVDSWTSCSTMNSYSNWPNQGGAAVMIFSPCLSPVPDPTDPELEGAMILGWFDVTASAAGQFGLQSGSVIVADCDGFGEQPEVGSVGFNQPGSSPCGDLPPVPVQATTWGRMKARR